MRLSTGCILLVLFLTMPGFSQDKLPDTPAGRSVAAYLEAFNSGDTAAMRAYYRDHLAKTQEQPPIGMRLDRFRQMRQRLGSLSFVKALGEEEGRISILVHSSGGDRLRFEFEFEKTPPHGILGISVELLEAPAASVDRKRNDDELLDAVDELLGRLVKAGEFSGVVLVAKGGKPLLQRAHGMADEENGIPNRIDTKFNIGSINKSFTALAIHQLVDRGKISHDDPIGKFIPDYPNADAAKKVTVRHLLEMSSGIGDIFGKEYEATPKENLRTISDFLPLFADKPLEFEPGTRRRYSNGGYIVLGVIIEKVTGGDYHTYVAENIFLPAGMKETGSFFNDAHVANRAVGYAGRGEKQPRSKNTPMLPGRGSSAGGGYSTAQDLLNYTIALDESRICSPEYDGRRGFGIAGGAPGINAALEWDPESGYTIIVLSNFDPPSAESVARQIRGWLPRSERTN